jgi:predicted RNase H-like HicB family nuclease
VQYLVVIERGYAAFGASVPDLPGCIATAESDEAVRALIKEAIEFQIEGLRENGEAVPAPSSSGTLVEVSAA